MNVSMLKCKNVLFGKQQVGWAGIWEGVGFDGTRIAYSSMTSSAVATRTSASV